MSITKTVPRASAPNRRWSICGNAVAMKHLCLEIPNSRSDQTMRCEEPQCECDLTFVRKSSTAVAAATLGRAVGARGHLA